MRQTHVPAAPVVRVVAREQVHLGRHRHVVDVALAARNNLQPRAIGTHADHAAAVQLDARAVLADRIRRAVIAHGDVEETIDGHPHSVDRVVRATELEIEAKSVHQHLLPVGDAIAVVVVKRLEQRRVHHVERVAIEPDPARRIHLRERDKLVRLAIAIRVGAAHDASASALGVERAILVDADVEIALGGRAQAGGITHLGRQGEERNLPARRRLHGFQKRLRRGRLRVAPGRGREVTGQETCDDEGAQNRNAHRIEPKQKPQSPGLFNEKPPVTFRRRLLRRKTRHTLNSEMDWPQKNTKRLTRKRWSEKNQTALPPFPSPRLALCSLRSLAAILGVRVTSQQPVAAG